MDRLVHLYVLGCAVDRYVPDNAVQKLRRLLTDFPSRQPGFEPGSGHVGFLVDEAAVGHVFFESFGFIIPTYCSTLIIIRGWYSRSIVASVIVDSAPLQPAPFPKVY
jgi:hypothetical protein